MTKLEYGCYLTAVLSYLMTRQQDAVGLTTFDREVRLDMPARSSPRHFHEMMQRLEAIAPGGETDVAETLHGGQPLQTPLPDCADQRPLRRAGGGHPALHHFRHRRHEVILFHVLDKAEIEFPFRERPPSTTWRPASGSRSTRPTARRILARSRRLSTSYRRACAEAQIDYVLTDTSTPYDFMLSRYLAKRSRR